MPSFCSEFGTTMVTKYKGELRDPGSAQMSGRARQAQRAKAARLMSRSASGVGSVTTRAARGDDAAHEHGDLSCRSNPSIAMPSGPSCPPLARWRIAPSQKSATRSAKEARIVAVGEDRSAKGAHEAHLVGRADIGARAVQRGEIDDHEIAAAHEWSPSYRLIARP